MALLWLMACGRPEPGASPAAAPDAVLTPRLWKVESFSETWTYVVGSSPRLANGDWLWAQPSFEDTAWQQQARTGTGAMRRSAKELWARVRMTGPALASPMLSLKISGDHAEAYLNGRPLPTEDLAQHIWKEHPKGRHRLLIYLPRDYAGQVLSIHLQSSHLGVGFLSSAFLGESSAVSLNLLRSVIPSLLLSGLSGFIALGALIFFLLSRKDFALLHLSLMCAGTCLSVAAVSDVLNVLFFPSPASFTVALSAGLMIGAGLWGFSSVVLLGNSLRFLRWGQYAVYLGIFLLIATSYFEPRWLVYAAVPVYVMELVLTVFLIPFIISKAIGGHIDAKIICVGFGILGVFVIPDLLTLVGAWKRPLQYFLIQSGLFCCLLSMGLVVIRRFLETHRKLGQYGALLAEQVHTLERSNSDIQRLNEELRRQIELRSDRMIELLSRSQPKTEGQPPKALATGQLLTERYRVVRALGKGAMGTVYEIERTSDKLHLAAKLLTAKAGRSAMVRFVREARVLAKLHHPNLVTIADIDFSTEGELFLVMELVQGTTLKDAKSRYADLEFVWSVLRQISLGLKAVHAQGVVHRDLKPANVLLAQSGDELTVKIADFGIASLAAGRDASSNETGPIPKQGSQATELPAAAAAAELPKDAETDDQDDELPTADVTPGMASPPPEADEAGTAGSAMAPAPHSATPDESLGSSQMTETGVVLGTPLYMAPELAGGSRSAPPSSDLFSLGVIAFEMLAGKLPFTVPPVILVWNNQPLVIPRLGTLRPDLPQPVITVLERCLDSDPLGRPDLDELIALFSQAPPRRPPTDLRGP